MQRGGEVLFGDEEERREVRLDGCGARDVALAGWVGVSAGIQGQDGHLIGRDRQPQTGSRKRRS